MIENEVQLGEARRRLDLMERGLDALRVQLIEENPALFPIASAGYTRGIRELHEEIEGYLATRPSKAPLRMRLLGPAARDGRIAAGALAKALTAFQELLRQEARRLDNVGARHRGDIELTLVASAPGSFIVAMEVGGSGQGSLFPEDTVGERAVRLALRSMRQLGQAAKPREDDLRPLARLTNLLNEGAIEGIEFAYGTDGEPEIAALTLSMRDRLQKLLMPNDDPARLVRGTLISLNVEDNVCRIRPQGQRAVRCLYSEEIEDDVVAAVRREIEVSGDIERDATTGHVTIRRIEGLRILPNFDDSSSSFDQEVGASEATKENVAVREERRRYRA